MEITVLRIDDGLAYYEGNERADVVRLLSAYPKYIAFCMHYPTLLVQSGNRLTTGAWNDFLVPSGEDVVNVIVGTPEDVGNYVWPIQ